MQGVFAAHQRGTDAFGHDHHFQQIGLFDQRNAQLVGQRNQARRDRLNVRVAGEDHHAGDPALLALHQQMDQVFFIAGMVDSGDKHQLPAHDPFGDIFIFRHVVPANRQLQPLLTGAQAHGGEPLQGEDFADRQAHGYCSVTESAAG